MCIFYVRVYDRVHVHVGVYHGFLNLRMCPSIV